MLHFRDTTNIFSSFPLIYLFITHNGRLGFVRCSRESQKWEGWEVRGGSRHNGLSVVDLDTVHMDGDSDGSTKHVRFSARNGYLQFGGENTINRWGGEIGRDGRGDNGIWEKSAE